MSSTEFEPPTSITEQDLFYSLTDLLPGFDPSTVLSVVVASNVLHPSPLGEPGPNRDGGLCVQVSWVDRHGRTHSTFIAVTKGPAS